jgi:nicotinate-nucleotide adenylyltransferase
MVERAIADNPNFRLSRIDADRPGLSYSVDTVRALQAELGPAARIFFIIGADSLIDLPTWREPARLLQLCQVVAVSRPGYEQTDLACLDAVIPGAARRIIRLTTPGVDVSSTELRRRVAEGKPIRYLVPDAVRAYILERGLYRAEVAAGAPDPV